jgi:hypothetical protein
LLLFMTENQEIRASAFSEAAPGKSGPFGQPRIRTFCFRSKFQFRVFGLEDRQDHLEIE